MGLFGELYRVYYFKAAMIDGILCLPVNRNRSPAMSPRALSDMLR